MSFDVNIFINVFIAFGTVGAVMCSLNLLPLKSNRINGVYWLEKDKNKEVRICIELTNKSQWFDNIFVPKQGVLVKTDTNSRYLTLNADREEYLIARGTTRLLKLKTPKGAEAFRFFCDNPQHTLWIFTIDNQHILLKPKGVKNG